MIEKRFRNDIQGLRGIAVGAVVLEHAFPHVVSGGYVGVDIFFVISGFLIAGIVARDIDQSRFSIVEFYRRRVRRIIPALIVVLLATLLAGAFVLGPQAYAELGETSASTLAFVANFEFSRLSGYFDGDSKLKPLLHMWSLSVEEQFYIFFPPFMLIFWRKFGQSRTRWLLLGLAVASLLSSLALRHVSETVNYYMLPSRAFEILIGALFALGMVPPLHGRMLRHGVSLLGLAMILASFWLFTPATPVPGLAALLPCLGAALVIHAGSGGAEADGVLGSRLLSFPPLVFIGAISYSLYLWHWPILSLMRNLMETQLPVMWGVAAVGASVLAATASYYGVEQPFLSARARVWPVLALGAGAIAAVGALCVVVMLGHGFPHRFSAPAQALFARSNDYNHRRDTCHYDGGKTMLLYAHSCTFGAAVTPDVAVWGDSHGAELVVYLGERAGHVGRSVRELTASACPPTLDFALRIRPRCPDWNRQVLAGLVADPAIRTVVFAVNATGYPDGEALKAGLGRAVQALSQAGKTVVLVKQIPTMPFDPPQKAGVLAQFGLSPQRLGADWPFTAADDANALANARDASLDGLAGGPAASSRVSTYDPKSVLCQGSRCNAYRPDAGLLYFNKDHLSMSGVGFAFAPLADRLYGR